MLVGCDVKKFLSPASKLLRKLAYTSEQIELQIPLATAVAVTHPPRAAAATVTHPPRATAAAVTHYLQQL